MPDKWYAGNADGRDALTFEIASLLYLCIASAFVGQRDDLCWMFICGFSA